MSTIVTTTYSNDDGPLTDFDPNMMIEAATELQQIVYRLCEIADSLMDADKAAEITEVADALGVIVDKLDAEPGCKIVFFKDRSGGHQQ